MGADFGDNNTRIRYLAVRCARDILKKQCRVQELAEEYGVTDRTLYRYIKDVLPSVDRGLSEEVRKAMVQIKSQNRIKLIKENKSVINSLEAVNER